MPKGTPFKYGRNICIFCEGKSETKISEEHIWPEWAHDILPRATLHGIVAGKVDKKDLTSHTHKTSRRQGNVFNFRVKKVCQNCNNGWMAAYEQQVRPFLEPMMLGRQTFLSEAGQQLLLEYLTYKFLILDVGFGPEDQFIPPEAAHRFYSDRSIPNGMDLYILNCNEGDWQIGIRTVGGSFSREPLDPKAPPNVKSFAVGFGHLFVFAVFRKQGEFDYNFEPGVSIRLWPRLSPQIRWPTMRPIHSGQAEYIAMSVWRANDAPFTIDFGKGGPLPAG